MKMFLCSLFVQLFVPSPSSNASQDTLNVAVSGLRNDTGLVGVRIFANKEGFSAEGDKAYREVFMKPSNDKVVFEILDLPFGVSTIGSIHDENSKKDFDKNFVGIPKEGFSLPIILKS